MRMLRSSGLFSLEEMSVLCKFGGHALVRLKDTSMPWRDWRKCPYLGEAEGHIHALVRLEEMSVLS